MGTGTSLSSSSGRDIPLFNTLLVYMLTSFILFCSDVVSILLKIIDLIEAILN